MTPYAARCFRRIARRCRVVAPLHPHRWLFDHGVMTEWHAELAALGIIVRMLGTTKGFAWKLSDEGLAKVRAMNLPQEREASGSPL